MNVLIAVASKHGATMEIGEVIANSLGARGLDVTLGRVEDVASLDGIDAVVLGSSVYAGHWRRAARVFVDEHEAELRALPTWLFSSGPIGDPPKPMENPAEAISVSQRLGSRGHRLFAGKIDNDELGIAEKALIKLVRAPDGDFRPWSDISLWADSIASALLGPATATA